MSHQALELGLRVEPATQKLKDAAEHATFLLRTQRAEQRALASNRAGGVDLLGIQRGGCRCKGCECAWYVQRHTPNAVHLLGRGYVRHDNKPELLRCECWGLHTAPLVKGSAAWCIPVASPVPDARSPSLW